MNASSSRPVRTYSRRNSTKNTAGITLPSPDRSVLSTSSGRLYDEAEPPRKRRILSNGGAERENHSMRHRAHERTPRSTNRSPTPAAEAPIVPSSPARDGADTDCPRIDKGKGKATQGGNVTRTSATSTAFRDVSSSTDETTTSLPTTPKWPKGLSRIFEFASPHRSQPWGTRSPSSPGQAGIAKKMLARARTESSIGSSPSKESVYLTPKSQSFSTSRSRETSHIEDFSPSRPHREGFSRQSSFSTNAVGLQHPQRANSSNFRTYGGQSRSFLVTIPTATLLNRNGQSGIKANSLDEDDDDSLRESYAELRKRYGIDNSEGADADAGNLGSAEEGFSLYNPLFSITDLRSKGESRRFRDEMGYLFEGLEPSTALSVRRTSALDIISKLSDPDFWKKTRAAGLIVDIWDRLREAGAGDGNKVLDPILACFAALASEDPRDISLLAIKEDFVETIVKVMVVHGRNDPLGSSGSGGQLKLNKAEMSILHRLRDILSSKTSIVHEGCQSSTRLLLSCSLSSVPSLAFRYMNVVLDSASDDMASVCARLAAYRSGLTLFLEDQFSTMHEKLCFDHIYNCLAVLDLYLLELEASDTTPILSKMQLRCRYRTLPSQLIALIVVADVVDRSSQIEGTRSRANDCSDLAFRVLINLTNGDPSWTDAVVADPFTLPTTIRLIMSSHRSLLQAIEKKAVQSETMKEVATAAMDRLCLSLALLTNLLQERNNLAYSLQHFSLDPTCPGNRTCLLGCRCANSVSAVAGIANLYVSFLKDEDEELIPDIQFLRGHLSVLLGLILLQLHNPDVSGPSPASRSPDPSRSNPYSPSPTFDTIIDSLPGPSDSHGRRQKVMALIDNVEAFSHLYASLASKVGVPEEGESEGPCLGRDEDRPDSEDDTNNAVPRSHRNGYDSDVIAGVAASLRSFYEDLYRG